MSSLQAVLGIPVPQCVRVLPRPPPLCFPRQGDISAIELLTAFGTGLGRGKNEITQACNLASGLSDIVVILERPRAKTYATSFEQFVRDSPTLQAVDELIRFATRGARSIHTVTVLDAFSFQEEKGEKYFDKRCHQLLAHILRAKKPNVVLRCHTDAYQDEWMERFGLPYGDYELARVEVDVGDGHKTVAIQSFHPSMAVNNAHCRPEYRALLIHHFVAAFAELHGGFELPKYVEKIRQLCVQKGERNISDLKPWKAASLISKMPISGDDTLEDWRRSGPRDDKTYDTFFRQAQAFRDMYRWLEGLAGEPCTCGTLRIAKVVLFFWGRHFRADDDPLYEQVLWLLRLRGSEQPGWFPPDREVPTGEVPLEEQPSHSRLTDTQRPMLGINAEHVQQALQAHKELKGYLTRSSVTDFVRNLRIAGLVKQHDVFFEMMTSKENSGRKDSADFLGHLGSLRIGYPPLPVPVEKNLATLTELTARARPRTPPQKANRPLTPETNRKRTTVDGMSHLGSTGPLPQTPSKKSKYEADIPVPPSPDTPDQRGGKRGLSRSGNAARSRAEAAAYKVVLRVLQDHGFDRIDAEELHNLIASASYVGNPRSHS